jgi:HEAT repeat protein
LLALAVGAGVAYGPVRNWYYLQQLARASGAAREGWVERVAGLGEAALPGLCRLLNQDDARACDNARAALDRITQGWPADDPRWAELVGRLAADYPQRSLPGRENTLQQLSAWLRLGANRRPRALGPGAERLLTEVQHNARDVEGPALDLVGALLALPDEPHALAACRELVRRGLASAEAENRIRAIEIAQQPRLGLLAQVTPLLSDPQPEVRRAALLAVGPSPEAITTDNLLPWLHDADADVRRLCEAALLARSDFRPEHLHLARLITSPQPAVRLQVLGYLQRDSSLEPGIWLRRLSHDPAPEVRAAAVRAAAAQADVDLTDLLEQKAQGDPSPTVSQLARYYLHAPKQR